MTSVEDSPFFEYKDYYKIIPDIFKDQIKKYIKDGKRVKNNFVTSQITTRTFSK